MPTFTVTLSDQQLATLVKFAKQTTAEEDADEQGESFNPYDYSGGNFDDAYAIGEVAGQIHGARDILDLLGVSYE